MRSTGRRRSLRILSSDFIGKATDETATQVTRIGLTFLGTTAFCLLSLLSPDSALLGGSERISVPFAGPVSFFGFMLLGPAVLIVLRIYLQIYVEHSERLERLARSMSIARAPMLVPLQNPLIRYFSGLIFYLLLPLTMLLFAWKAAVFPAWGSGLLSVAVAVVASHLMLPLKKFSWPSKAFLSAGAAIVVAAMIVAPQIQSHLSSRPPHKVGQSSGPEQHAPLKGAGLVRRPFALFRANLSGQWLDRGDLRGANLRGANLIDANLYYANLSGAHLIDANLSGARLLNAHLIDANLSGAHLTGARLNSAHLTGARLNSAHLSGAELHSAKLSGASLSGADLTGAKLIFADLSGAHLIEAILIGANLSRADLSGANLSRANLSGANLTGAKNLTQEQLDQACGNTDTKPPVGLTLKAMCKQ